MTARKPKTRDTKRIQREPVSPVVRSAIETELWFRLNKPNTRTRTDAQDIFEEMLHWFLARAEKTSPSYETIDARWPRLTFWLDTETLNRCKVLAKRDGVTKRQVIGTAFTLYCAQFVSSALESFREETSRRGDTLYRQHREAVRKRPSKIPRP